MSCLTVPHGGGTRSAMPRSGKHVPGWGWFRSSGMSRPTIFTFLICECAGFLSWEELGRATRALQAWAWAETTRATLNSEQRSFIAFCRLYNVDYMPVSGETLVMYTGYLVLTGRLRAIGSVKQYLSAVSTLHKMFGLTCHTPSSYGPLLFTVVGIRRRLARPVHKMSPIMAEILYNLLTYPSLETTTTWGCNNLLLTLRALYVLLYFSMLRSSNLIPPAPGKVETMRQLTWGMVARHEDGVVLTVRLSKTIQFQERIHTIPWLASQVPVSVPWRR